MGIAAQVLLSLALIVLAGLTLLPGRRPRAPRRSWEARYRPRR